MPTAPNDHDANTLLGRLIRIRLRHANAYAGFHKTSWVNDCTPVVDRIHRFPPHEKQFEQPRRGFAFLTDDTLLVDQAIARTQQLERELHAARQEHKRDVASLTLQVRALRELFTELSSPQLSEPVGSPFEDEHQLAELRGLTDAALRGALGDAYLGHEAVLVADEAVGGRTVELTLRIASSREEFRDMRRKAIDAFDEATARIDTSTVVVSVERSE